MLKGQSSVVDSLASHRGSPYAIQAELSTVLLNAIAQALPTATVRIRQRMPVWFLGGNPVVGCCVRQTKVTLRFWNGQSFGEPMLAAVGQFRAAQIEFQNISQVDIEALHRWLRKARSDVWDIASVRNKMLASPSG